MDTPLFLCVAHENVLLRKNLTWTNETSNSLVTVYVFC